MTQLSPQPKFLTEAAALKDVLAQLRPRWMDLLHDMGSSEVFLVDGESLVIELLSFQRCSQVLGGAPLAAVYYAERLLQQLIDRGGQFVIVFYEAFSAAWRQQPSAWALRQVLLNHLQRVQQQLLDANGASSFEVLVHAEFTSDAWKQSLNQLKPKFVLVTDIVLDCLGSSNSQSMEDSSSSSSSGDNSLNWRAVPGLVQDLLLVLFFQYLAVGSIDLVYLGQLRCGCCSPLLGQFAAPGSLCKLQTCTNTGI